MTQLAGKNTILIKPLLSGIFWSFSGSLLSRAMMLLTSFIVSRRLGVDAFGEYGIVQSTTLMLGEVVGVGIGLATVKHLSQYRDTTPQKASAYITLNIAVAIFVSLLISVMLFSNSNALAERLFDQADLAGILKIGAFTVFFGALSSAQLAALSGFEAFRSIANINILVALFSAVLQIILVHFLKLDGVIIALCVAQIINLTLGAHSMKQQMRKYGLKLCLRPALRETKSLVSVNLPILFSNMLVVPVNWMCNVILVNSSDGLAQMGIYSAANQWKMAFLYIPSAIASVALPILTRSANTQSVASYRGLIWINLSINVFVGTFAVGFCALFGHHIMAGYGPGFTGSEQVLKAMAFVALLTGVNNLVGQVITSRGKHWIGVLFNLGWAIMLLLATYKLVPMYGALGLALASAVAYGTHTAWQMIYMSRLIKSVGVQ